MSGKRKKKIVKRKGIKISRRGKAIVLLTGCIMAFCVVAVVYHMLGTYDGLGLKMQVPKHTYQMNRVTVKEDRFHYRDEAFESVSGIDVSEFQGEIDWEAVKRDGIEFAIIRLGYRGSETGALALDACFEKNIKAAKDAGIEVGVYFFSQAVTPEEAIEEARFVLKHIKRKHITFPIAFDMEPIDGTERTADLTKTEKTEIADAFCQVIDRNGYTSMIYGNPQWLKKHIDRSYLTAYSVWLAHYGGTTDYTADFQMWQYTDSGTVAGIIGPVDMNMFFCKLE